MKNIIDWGLLTSVLDYHHKKWYGGEADKWYPINRHRAQEILSGCAAESDHEWIIKQFIYRDNESHARSRDSQKEAQLALGDWV